jgi:hypothetical protein
VAQQVARLLGVVAVHRRAMPERVAVRQPQLTALDVTRYKRAVVIDQQVTAPTNRFSFCASPCTAGAQRPSHPLAVVTVIPRRRERPT